MSTNPLISVIIPVYNGETFVGECIESVIAQTYRNLEILVVDDGSSDSTHSIVAEYAGRDNRITLLTQRNAGPSAARNLALDNATGEYLTFVDADDIISHEYIEVLYALADTTGAQIAACYYTRDLGRLGLVDEPYETISSQGYVADVLYQRFSDNSVWGKLYQSRLWENVRFKDMRYEDLEIFPRICLKAERVTVTRARLYYYRPNDDGFIQTFTPHRLDSLLAMDHIDRHIAETGLPAAIAKAARSRRLSASFNVFLITHGMTEYADANRRSWDGITRLRGECLMNSNVILKIKLGALCSYAGRNMLVLLNRLFGISS